jgi:hypothetical protein
MIVAVLLVLQASLSQPAPLSPEAVNSTHAFLDCLGAQPMHSEAIRLERSRASTADFFQAAQRLCARELNNAHRELVASYEARSTSLPRRDPRQAATDLLILVADNVWREFVVEMATQRAEEKRTDAQN